MQVKYNFTKNVVQDDLTIENVTEQLVLQSETHVPKVGVLLVGMGGNNGSTFMASTFANKHGIAWDTKEGRQNSTFTGSVALASTCEVGVDKDNTPVYRPIADLLPISHPNDWVIHGWDINGANMYDAMKRAKVLHVDLQRQLKEYMEKITPMPSIYYPDFIAQNQAHRADNLITGDQRKEHLEHIRHDIRQFREKNGLDKVIVLWTANTERFCSYQAGVHDTADALLEAIENNHPEISPSTIFGTAAIMEDAIFINGSPQNTCVPGLIHLAKLRHGFVAGDDFKSGQTKIKSSLVEFLIESGIKPRSIVSYNHLGNNDGMNLSSAAQFKSKEISKRNVVDDMVASNQILYDRDEHPDHIVVIKYVPTVGDSKRAMDEYTNEIFMGGRNTVTMHNVCEDSLLATPLMMDLVIFGELLSRLSYAKDGIVKDFSGALEPLSLFLKAPLHNNAKTGALNALSKQRNGLVQLLLAFQGVQPVNQLYRYLV